MKNRIYLTQPLLSGKEMKYLADCVKSTWISTGKYVSEFEENFAKYCNVSLASTTSSGTTALYLALLALNIKTGDEVIVPDFTYVATANVVHYIGAKPVFVDVDKDTWTIDVSKIEQKITGKTKAIIPVHIFGYPADMDKINVIAKKHNLFVIEDACQALGTLYKGKKVGSLSDIGCFSFSGAKIITTGEGGIVLSRNKKLMERISAIKSNFTDKKRHFYHSEVGYPFRLTNLQAALGLAQLEAIDKLVNLKISNAKIYKNLLKSNEIIQLPPETSGIRNVFWLYSIVFKKKGLRDGLMKHLEEKNIQTRPFFSPLHTLPMYKRSEKYLTSQYISENGISLPSGSTLTLKDIEYVCREIDRYIKKHD